MKWFLKFANVNEREIKREKIQMRPPLHCKYIDRKYYDILLCFIYHRNLVVICTADGRIQPMIVPSTTIPWFQPLVVVCQSRFIVDIGIKEKYRIQWQAVRITV